MSPDGVLRCRKCREERMLTKHEGLEVVLVYCEACAYTSRYPKPQVEVPVAGEGEKEGGYGFGV